MNKKNLTPKNVKPVIRKSSVSLPELHEEQLTGGTGGISDTNAIAPAWNVGTGAFCSFEGDDA